MYLRFTANFIQLLNAFLLALLLIFAPSISSNNDISGTRKKIVPDLNGARNEFVEYKREYENNQQTELFAYRLTHEKKKINYIVVIKTEYGHTVEGYLFYNDYDDKMRRVALSSFCLKQGSMGIEIIIFTNSSDCDIAYYQNHKIFVSKSKGYKLEQIERAGLIDPNTGAIIVKTEFVSLYRMSNSYIGSECSNGPDFEHGVFYRKCSEEQFLLKYDGREPIGIENKMNPDSEYLALFYDRGKVMVLDRNFIYCGREKNSCHGFKFKPINYRPSISFTHPGFLFLLNEVVTVQHSSEKTLYQCKSGWAYRPSPFSGVCRLYTFVGSTLYFSNGDIPKAVCNFRKSYLTLLNDYYPD